LGSSSTHPSINWSSDEILKTRQTENLEGHRENTLCPSLKNSQERKKVKRIENKDEKHASVFMSLFIFSIMFFSFSKSEKKFGNSSFYSSNKKLYNMPHSKPRGVSLLYKHFRNMLIQMFVCYV